jgi:SAM-dependent methyltransferase
MAITAVAYQVFAEMRNRGIWPQNQHVLEIGESNWYGDVPLETLIRDAKQWTSQEQWLETFGNMFHVAINSEQPLFDLAKAFYRVLLQPASMTAIDYQGTETAQRQDLNHPLALPRQYGIVVNLGTAEHVFDIAQVFRSIHDATAPGGIMVHHLPLSGWIDHGFYAVNPTLYWDLAAANGYEIGLIAYTEIAPPKIIELPRRESILELAKNGGIGANSLIMAVLRKADHESEFAVPWQGVYTEQASKETAEAWRELR